LSSSTRRSRSRFKGTFCMGIPISYSSSSMSSGSIRDLGVRAVSIHFNPGASHAAELRSVAKPKGNLRFPINLSAHCLGKRRTILSYIRRGGLSYSLFLESANSGQFRSEIEWIRLRNSGSDDSAISQTPADCGSEGYVAFRRRRISTFQSSGLTYYMRVISV
jgi:hypothetical protein